jgi:hypothetical protein
MSDVMNRVMARRCAVHQQRPGFAVCMQCAKALCQECATQWDGIWYCAQCLAARRGASRGRSHAGGWIAVIAASIVLLFFSTRLMVWTGVLLAGLR